MVRALRGETLNIMEIDGYKAKIQYDPELDQFRGEILGLNGGADFYGNSPASLRREFKRSLGLTPRQYLTQCRLEEARRLLRTTDLQVNEVARRVGFTSASHFAEVFRKRVGLRPRDFRKRHHA